MENHNILVYFLVFNFHLEKFFLAEFNSYQIFEQTIAIKLLQIFNFFLNKFLF